MSFIVPASVNIENPRLAWCYYIIQLLIILCAVLLLIFWPSLAYCQWEQVRTSSSIGTVFPDYLEDVMGATNVMTECARVFAEIPWEMPGATCKIVCTVERQGIDQTCVKPGDVYRSTTSAITVHVSELEMISFMKPDISQGSFRNPYVISNIEFMEMGITVSYEHLTHLSAYEDPDPPACGVIVVDSEHKASFWSGTNFIKLKLLDIFTAMHGMPADLQIGGKQILYRSSGVDSRFPPAVRALGAEVSMKADCFWSSSDISLRLNGDLPVEPKDGAPVCLLYFNWVPPVSPTWPAVVGEQPQPLVWRVNIRVTQADGRGDKCRFHWGTLVTFLALVLLIMQYPVYLVRYIAVHWLGQLSTVYRRAILKPFNMAEAFAQLGARLVCASVSYVDLVHWDGVKQHGSKAEGVPKWRVRERLKKAFGDEFDHLDDEHVERFITMCHHQGVVRHQMHAPSDRDIDLSSTQNQIMTCQAFCAACTADEIVDLHELVELCDAKRTRGFMETCFTPAEIKFFINASIDEAADQDTYHALEHEREADLDKMAQITRHQSHLDKQTAELMPQLDALNIATVDEFGRPVEAPGEMTRQPDSGPEMRALPTQASISTISSTASLPVPAPAPKVAPAPQMRGPLRHEKSLAVEQKTKAEAEKKAKAA